MKKFLKWLLILFVLGAGFYSLVAYQLSPYGKGGNIYIPKGFSVSRIAELLENRGILRNRTFFKLLVRLKKVQADLKPGEYEFAPQSKPLEVLNKLIRGDRVIHKLVIPEGYTFAQIAQSIETAGIAKAQDVLRYYRDPSFIRDLGLPINSLEGFLFPATYEYDRGTQLPDLMKEMIQSFQKNYDASLQERTLAIGWTVPQVVTLASIVEKETGRAEERPLVSSVFHNRLRQGMLLQSDPTVIFGLPNYDGNIRQADLSNPHPYNTYVHNGLPPGPIASPGKESLKAVLYPPQTNYLYFVAKGDGTHYFSSTFEEHQAAVAQYQLNRQQAPVGQGPETKETKEKKY